jgi:ubiquinone/menaquinone biosynthesis C-methylase UbiE/uncharacterized protein YbaR (Trm112 family)
LEDDEMKRTTLDLLACPTCRGELVLRQEIEDGSIERGGLFCPHCNKEFPIEQSIPHFIRVEELTGLNRLSARIYDLFSPIYAPFMRFSFSFWGGEDYIRQDLLDHLEFRGGRVLDVSIGPGVNLRYLTGRPGVDEVYGLDISRGQLNRCQRNSQIHGWPVELFLGNAECLPFKDDSFDVVYQGGGINFCNDKKQAIEEMIRVAKPGTKILINDDNKVGLGGYKRRLPGNSSGSDGRWKTTLAPIDLVPSNMEDIHLEDPWHSGFFLLVFRKPVRRIIGG